jgi:hypothetical protein
VSTINRIDSKPILESGLALPRFVALRRGFAPRRARDANPIPS